MKRTAYGFVISDWSSDVCSSDLTRILLRGSLGALRKRLRRKELHALRQRLQNFLERHLLEQKGAVELLDDGLDRDLLGFGVTEKPRDDFLLDGRAFEPCSVGRVTCEADQIGRASCRERVCQYG